MPLEDLQQAIARLSPEERARLRAWLAQFDARPPEPTAEPQTAAEKLGRFAGRALADVKKRIRDT